MSSFGLTTFDSKGKLSQIENALQAVNQHGKPCVGIKAKNGVVLVSEKRKDSPSIDASSLRKIEVIDDHVGCTFSGMPADFRILLAKARRIAIEYRLSFNAPIPIVKLVRDLAFVVQEFTQSGGARPCGCSFLIAGFDQNEEGRSIPHLYQLDPSGTSFAWKGCALGKDSTTAQAYLEKRLLSRAGGEIELEDAVHTAILTLREVFEGGMNEKYIEVAVVGVPKDGETLHAGKPPLFRVLNEQEIKNYFSEVDLIVRT